jgi:hypothetical protein
VSDNREFASCTAFWHVLKGSNMIKTIWFYTWPLVALVAMVGAVAVFDNGVTGKIIRVLLEIAIS